MFSTSKSDHARTIGLRFPEKNAVPPRHNIKIETCSPIELERPAAQKVREQLIMASP